MLLSAKSESFFLELKLYSNIKQEEIHNRYFYDGPISSLDGEEYMPDYHHINFLFPTSLTLTCQVAYWSIITIDQKQHIQANSMEALRCKWEKKNSGHPVSI